jgi:hypothetical protein
MGLSEHTAIHHPPGPMCCYRHRELMVRPYIALDSLLVASCLEEEDPLAIGPMLVLTPPSLPGRLKPQQLLPQLPLFRLPLTAH